MPTMYTDKYSSNITNSTTNKGVEAKETEVANTHLDGDVESARSGGAGSAPPTPRHCPSYLQVVVEKHRRAPVASSPAGAAPAPSAPATLSARCGERPRGEAAEAAEAECVEVYRFLRVGAAAALGAGAGSAAHAAAWRRSARVRRGARAGAAELGAATRLALGGPLAGALLALRWSLRLARDAGAGALLAGSDYALKPALALLFNALLHPLLVFVANVLQGAHEAARPLCSALGECAAHTGTVLGAVRLVAVSAPACRCACSPTRSPAP